MKSNPHGGRRKGAGRPILPETKKKEPTEVIRVPKSLIPKIKLMIEKHNKNQ